MLQEFSINDLKETIEKDELYAIMNKRMTYCKNLCVNEYSAGPPDICYLVRETFTKGFLGIKGKKANKTGGYHYVFGLDTSNVAYISAYISKYIQKINAENSNLPKNPSTGNTKITQSIFCVFDIFYEKDLRILIKFPGGIRKIFYINDTQAIEANPDELRTVFLSSIVRSWCYSDFPIHGNCIFLEEINNTKTFDYLVESISYVISEKAEYKFPNFDKKLEIILTWFIRYLMATRRFSFAVSYFSKCTSKHITYL